MSEWVLAESTTVSRFRYDNERQILIVEFKSGVSYEYYDVPNQVFEDMTKADSTGKYLNSEIKGHYRYARQ